MTRLGVFGLSVFLSLMSAALATPGPLLFAQVQTDAPNSLKGMLERIRVHGASLEGNLEGDSPDRDVVVYLPPSYAKEKTRRYPVIYFLHGYTVGAEMYVKMLGLQDAMDSAIGGGVRKMILVLPDAFTVYSGSMYSNSPTTGDWEAYISHDLIAYIDSHYRTIADRDSRGLAGHSMGGYGTIRIGMKHPEVFGALYTMSSCCLMNDPTQGQGAIAARGRGDAAPDTPARGNATPGQAPAAQGRGGGFSKALSAQAAAWAPNPMNPPQFFDLPTKDGQIQPLIAAKWIANSPLVMVDQYVPNLKKYRAIAMDVGDADPLGANNISLDRALTRLGVPHSFEHYAGDHTNRVAERFKTKVLPFFSQQLAFAANAVKSGSASGAHVALGGVSAGVGRAMARIEAPKPSGCITDVSPGDHTFSCYGITYLVMVDEMCTRLACGLIFDIHGAGMSADGMRANTGLQNLAPSKGYLVVHPSAAPTGIGSWSFETSPVKMADFMFRMIEVFHVDKARIHVTGFSMGAAMTFSFLCNHNDILASTAVVTGLSADQVRAPNGTRKCIDAIDENWHPRVPILFMNGVLDPALTPKLAHERREGIVSRLSLTGGEKVAGDGHYTRTRWTGAGGMVFDFLEHDYSSEGKLAGHCMPGGRPPNDTTCTKGEIKVNWGETALQWFLDHPKPQ